MMHPSDARFGARAVVACVALALAAVPFGLLLFLVQDHWDPLLDVDERARDSLHRIAVRSDALVAVLKALSFLGSAWVSVPLFAALAAWLVRRGLPRLAAFVVVTAAGSSLLNAVVKLAAHRARPVLPDPIAHASGMSFPSGHAQAAVVTTGILLLVFLPAVGPTARRVAMVLAASWVLAVGFARVALGVHYVSDVLAGVVLGAAWLAAMAAAFNAWRQDRGMRRVDPTEGLEPDHGARLRDWT